MTSAQNPRRADPMAVSGQFRGRLRAVSRGRRHGGLPTLMRPECGPIRLSRRRHAAASATAAKCVVPVVRVRGRTSNDCVGFGWRGPELQQIPVDRTLCELTARTSVASAGAHTHAVSARRNIECAVLHPRPRTPSLFHAGWHCHRYLNDVFPVLARTPGCVLAHNDSYRRAP